MHSFLAAFVLLIVPSVALGQGAFSARKARDGVWEAGDRACGERGFRTGGRCVGAARVVPVQEGMPEGLPEGMPWDQKSTDEGGGGGGEKAPAEDGGEGTPAPQEEAP